MNISSPGDLMFWVGESIPYQQCRRLVPKDQHQDHQQERYHHEIEIDSLWNVFGPNLPGSQFRVRARVRGRSRG
jgi:hypothetical protein